MAMLQPGSRLIQSVGRAPDPSRDAIVERVHERLVEDLDVRALDSLPEGERKAARESAVIHGFSRGQCSIAERVGQWADAAPQSSGIMRMSSPDTTVQPPLP